MSDGTLEEQFAGGDGAAYEMAYRAFGPRMLATALRLLRDREAASECVHDVFLELWRKRNAYAAARGSLEAFLVTCVRNRALTMIRSGERGKRAAQKLARPEEYFLEEDPIERARVARAVAQLNEGEAAVVQLAYYRGLTLSEVSDELAVPIGTVKWRLSSALRRLRSALIPESGYGI